MLVLEVVSKRPVSVTLHLLIATLERRKELEPKCAPQLILGSLLMTRRSAIGQFFSQSLETVPEVFAKVNSAHFPSGFKSGESVLHQWQ